MYLLRQEDGSPPASASREIPQGFATKAQNMLSGYGIVAPMGRVDRPGNADLDRYVRMEYGKTESVDTFLAAAGRLARQARPSPRRRIADAVRAFAKAFRAATAIREPEESSADG